MTFASGSRVQMAYVAETVFGTTPSTPQLINVPMVSTTLDLAKEVFADPSIVSDRMQRFERHGNYQVNGNLECTLQHGQWDDLIEAVLGGTWTTNVVKVGSTNKSFTVEQGFLDIAQFRRFTGVRVNTWELAVTPNAIIKSTFGLIGAGMTTAGATLDATPTAVQNKQPLVHIGSTVTVGGSAVKATAFSMKVDNKMTPNYAIGSSAAQEITWSESEVSGSMTFYFEDLTAYNRFVLETSAAISVALTDGTNTVTITVPAAKFNAATLPVSGSGNLFVTMPWKGLYDGTAATTVSVTRSA